MNQRIFREALLFTGLVAAGVAARVYFQDLPNFAPVAAIAMFAGVVFRSWIAAALVPLAIMVSSDLVIGFYDGRILALVYGSLALPVAGRAILRRQFSSGPESSLDLVGRTLTVLGCTLLSSVAFFVITNFGCWAFSPLYPRTASGLVSCYVAALPFFRPTLAGDLFFSALLFGSYAALKRGQISFYYKRGQDSFQARTS